MMVDRKTLDNHITRIEKKIAGMASAEVERLKQNLGERVADEVLLGVACLFAARAITVVHIWHGEKVDALKRRLFETFDHNVKVGLKIYAEVLARKEQQ